MKKIQCDNCNKVFDKYECQINEENNFCCTSCFYEYKKDNKEEYGNGIYRNCKTCNKEFYVGNWEQERKYCSQECYWNSDDPSLKKLQKRMAEKGMVKYNKKNGPWNKGLTKEDHSSLQEIAEKQSGSNNPMYGKDPWHKGKTNVYSEKRIENLRKQAVRQYKNGSINKVNTKPERKFKSRLKKNNISFEQSFYLNEKIYDFYIPESNILVEIDGVYWHGKGKDYEEMNEIQQKNYKNDKIKDKIAIENNYSLKRIWSDEIDNFNMNKLI